VGAALSNESAVTRVTLRFILIGIGATATYFGITVLLISSPIQLEPVLASAIASTVSILVSYIGHHRYTFNRQGRHDFHFPRFIAVTTFLFLSSTMAMYVYSHVVPTEPLYVASAIAVAYPIASYLLNLLWVFKPQ
jgi:putative flippase GtrA